MSKLLFASFRNKKPTRFSRRNIEILSKLLQPDNISFPSPYVVETKTDLAVIINPNSSNIKHGCSVCLGYIDDLKKWWVPGNQIPDGSFALFRSGENLVEVATDAVASRTIWYYHDEDMFLASTSQRALVFILGDFKFNNSIISWFLVSGTTGPGLSWDRRISMMEGDTRIFLNKSNWELKTQQQGIDFHQNDFSNSQHFKFLFQTLVSTFKNLPLNFNKWILPLSGGYDSRGILFMLKDIPNLKCITWGLKDSLNEKGNDAYIAKQIAEYFSSDHKYYTTEISTEDILNIFNRFLYCGEGRTDQISAYLDGFDLWKKLYEGGIEGIIRGDEGFGGRYVGSESDVRLNMGFPVFSDFSNLDILINLGIKEHVIPEWLKRNKTEKLEDWRDRVYCQYEMPLVFAALNDLKLSFVEVINPLLEKKILKAVRQMPIELRTDKILFKEIVNEIGPRIAYADKEAPAAHVNIFKDKNVVEEIAVVLSDNILNSMFPKDYIHFIVHKLKSKGDSHSTNKSNFKQTLKKIIPKNFKSLLRRTLAKPKLDYGILAFRTYIIIRMHQILIEDSKML